MQAIYGLVIGQTATEQELQPALMNGKSRTKVIHNKFRKKLKIAGITQTNCLDVQIQIICSSIPIQVIMSDFLVFWDVTGC